MSQFGFLEAVPNDIDARHHKAENKYADQPACGDLFAPSDLSRGEECGHRQCGENAAVDKRQTDRANGVI